GEHLAEQLVGHGIGDTLTLTLEDPSQRDEEGAAGTSPGSRAVMVGAASRVVEGNSSTAA
ncbi:MAG: hypothetical protein ACOC8X_03885, partial [Chloroflexota bacterium]